MPDFKLLTKASFQLRVSSTHVHWSGCRNEVPRARGHSAWTSVTKDLSDRLVAMCPNIRCTRSRSPRPTSLQCTGGHHTSMFMLSEDTRITQILLEHVVQQVGRVQLWSHSLGTWKLSLK